MIELVDKEKIEGIDCSDVLVEEAEDLVDTGYEMIEFCKKNNGAGLAAPQIGMYKKLFVISHIEMDPSYFEIVFNPMFYRLASTVFMIEGCLSYPKEYYKVKRFKEIGVVYYVFNGIEFVKRTKKLKRISAVIFQHEYDHLMGKTIKTEGEFSHSLKEGEKAFNEF